MSSKKYELTPENETMLKPWADKWIANAMSTAPMTDEDRQACVHAVHGMYKAANLSPPRVVFVPSPFVANFSAGFASALWHLKTMSEDATRDATEAATWAATAAATRAATRDVTWAATRAATEAATEAATWAATRAATWAATRDATRDATRAATCGSRAKKTQWFDVDVNGIVRLAHIIGGKNGEFLLSCARQAYGMQQGGNQWSGYDAYLSFFQDVAKLDLLAYENYQHWRTLSERSGPRYIHKEFCIISDRPEILLVDEANRPHCETGPFCRWRDSSALYAIHGVRVPGWVVESPEDITVKSIDAESNTEIQRVMIERMGWDRYTAVVGGEVLDHDDRWGTLRCRAMPSGDQHLWLEVINRSPEPDGTFRRYVLSLDSELRPIPDLEDGETEFGESQKLTALNAVASTFGMRGEDYVAMIGDMAESES